MKDQVNPLDEDVGNKPLKSKASSKSRYSSQYIDELKSQIDEEREARIKIQEQIEEIKRKNLQLLG